MSRPSMSWMDEIDEIDARILDSYQSGFPVEKRPFDLIATDLGISKSDVLTRLRRLVDIGLIRRVGPVLNPPVIGSSTLAAIQAPSHRYDEIAAVVNEYEQVNHNYERDHDWNMWFVVTAGSLPERDRILSEIGERTGCSVLNLPMRTDYYIDLEFPVVNDDRFARESTTDRPDTSPTRIDERPMADITPFEASLLLEVQNGLALIENPYGAIAKSLDTSISDVIRGVSRLMDTGCIKRIGCVIDHVATGFDANCMVVWDVPDDSLDEVGRRVGLEPYVTLCYHRPRRPSLDWSYNLFTMIHGRDPTVVEEKIDTLGSELIPYSHERLHTTRSLKQTGARYSEILGSMESRSD